MNDDERTNEVFYSQKNWGEFECLVKLPAEIDVGRLKQPKAILADEPLLPSMLHSFDIPPAQTTKHKK
jgi:hypothetical protein